MFPALSLLVPLQVTDVPLLSCPLLLQCFWASEVRALLLFLEYVVPGPVRTFKASTFVVYVLPVVYVGVLLVLLDELLDVEELLLVVVVLLELLLELLGDPETTITVWPLVLVTRMSPL